LKVLLTLLLNFYNTVIMYCCTCWNTIYEKWVVWMQMWQWLDGSDVFVSICGTSGPTDGVIFPTAGWHQLESH